MEQKLIYPKLSYKIVGILYDVFNEIGGGHRENYYQKALALALQENKITFKGQIVIPLKYKENKIGKYVLDFLIENKIVLEIKKDNIFRKSNIQQIYTYLKATGLKLGILANFTNNGVKFKRILNIK